MKKIFLSLMLGLLLIQNVYASEITDVVKEDNKLNYIYEVNKEERDSFVQNLEKEISYEDNKYKLLDYNIEEQDYIDTIEINDTKEVVSNSNSLEEIFNILPKTLNYEKDGYIGINNLDYDSIEITPIYNGYYEEYIDETKQYFDLAKNDMDYIPKEIKKDGHTLYLINVDWYIQTTKNTGDFEIGDLYRGEALYRGVKRIYNPYTYKVIAKYNGKAEKKIEKPYLIKVNYEKMQREEKAVEKKNNIAVPIVATSTGALFVVLLIFFFSNKVKVYSENKYIGRYKIKENVLDISNSINKTNSNNYILKFNNKLYEKNKGKTIKVVKGKLSKYCKIDNSNIEVKF